ncbi:MAG TPA: hypothetical protein VMW53_05650 [archaeon]|nr:hypothetical protein [archaeon]
MNDELKKEGDNSLKTNVKKTVVIMLIFLMFISLFSFFFNMQSAISELFDPRYEKLMQALFSLFVLGIGAFLVKMFLSK